MILDYDKMIRKTFALARKGLGTVSPNPLVGALIVDGNQKILSEGHHQFSGGPHAERVAINNCEDNLLEGATLFTNLEPCCHKEKKTPPCTDLIIEKKISKVVFSNLDPNPLVAGKGIAQLQKAGIEVIGPILQEEGEEINEIFFKNMKEKLPFIHLKMAQSLDGRIQSNRNRWISDEEARREVHQLRMKYDAVLIGRNTANIDDPSLTIREVQNYGKVPKRIVLGNPNLLNKTLRLFNDEYSNKTYIFYDHGIQLDKKCEDFFLAKGVGLVSFNSAVPSNLLKALMEKGIFSVLVEGGEKVSSYFFENLLFDRVTFYIATELIGQGPTTFSSALTGVQFKNKLMRTLNDQFVFEGCRL